MATKTRGLPRAANNTTNTTFDRISKSRVSQRTLLLAQIVLFAIIVAQFIMMYKSYVAAAAVGLVANAQFVSGYSSSSSSSGPDYYKTDPNYYPGERDSP
jgi:hypothetical protein